MGLGGFHNQPTRDQFSGVMPVIQAGAPVAGAEGGGP